MFWDVHDADRAVAIHLRDDRYTEIVIEVDDPAATIALVNDHAQGYGAGGVQMLSRA